MELLSIEMAPITQPGRYAMEAVGGINLRLKGEIRRWTYNLGVICLEVVL